MLLFFENIWVLLEYFFYLELGVDSELLRCGLLQDQTRPHLSIGGARWWSKEEANFR